MKSNRSANKSKAVKPGATYRRLKDAIAEMQAIRRGERAPSRAWEVLPDGQGGFIRRRLDPHSLAPARAAAENEAVAARTKLGLSQDTFAALLGVSPGTLRGWEQGRRQPNQAARVLLLLAARHPEAVLEAAKAAA